MHARRRCASLTSLSGAPRLMPRSLCLCLPIKGVEAPGVSVMAESYWEVYVVGRWDQVAPGHSAGLHIGLAAGWEEMVVTPWGGDHGSSDFSVVVSICQDGVGWRHVCPLSVRHATS
jgi:hypothetical protein